MKRNEIFPKLVEKGLFSSAFFEGNVNMNWTNVKNKSKCQLSVLGAMYTCIYGKYPVRYTCDHVIISKTYQQDCSKINEIFSSFP